MFHHKDDINVESHHICIQLNRKLEQILNHFKTNIVITSFTSRCFTTEASIIGTNLKMIQGGETPRPQCHTKSVAESRTHARAADYH